jgi:hypothetical protein
MPHSGNPVFRDLGTVLVRMYPKWAMKLSLSLLRHGLIAVILFLWLAFVAPSAFAQIQILVRVLDAESGKPLKGIGISLWGSNTGKFRLSQDLSWRSKFENTDAKGNVTFQLPDSVPQFLLVVSGPIDLHNCSNQDQEFSTNEVFRTGIVASYRYDPQKPRWCPRLKAQASAMPGEIVIFDKRFTTWERVLQEIP